MNGQERMRIFWEKTEDQNVRILRVFGMKPVVRLPEKLEGRSVTEIGAYCFAQTGRLPEQYEESVLVQETDAGDIFLGGENVTEEVGAESLLSDAEAQSGINMTELSGKYITEVILPDSLEKIGNLAFYNCTSLEKIELGNRTEMIGSDVFMNCRKFHSLTVRCGVAEASGIRQILNQVTADMKVIFQNSGKVEAVIFYPEYYESLDEVAPAHLFHRNIEGEGFRARQCFKDGVADLSQYDMIFPKACVEEHAKTLQKIVCARLRYPVDMKEEAQRMYETYTRAHEEEMMDALVREKSLDTIQYFCEKRYFTQQAMTQGIQTASEMEWAEGTASLLRLKQEFFAEKERYVFEDF